MFKKLLQTSVVLGMLVFPATAGAYVNRSGDEVCPGQKLEQAFSRFGDMRQYTPVENGNFEDGLTGWNVSGDVELVASENPFRPTPGASALVMKTGSSVTSPAICASRGYPVARLFQQKLEGANSGSLRVEVIYPPRVKGKGRTVKPAGRLKGSDVFAPSRKFAIGQGRTHRGTALIRFRFTVVNEATYLIDDLLLDPRCRS